MPFPPLHFEKERLRLLDQRRLPEKEVWIKCRTAEEVARAIQEMVIRGAPAIGIAGGYGLYLGIKDFKGSKEEFFKTFLRKAEVLQRSRPTGANLAWALRRIERKIAAADNLSVPKLKSLVLEEAKNIEEEDDRLCRAIGRQGARLFHTGDSILTHCNAGGLATSGFGTALGVLYTLQEEGKSFQVYVTETRPLLQGSRLTAWELTRAKIPCTLICESTVGSLMKQGKIQGVIVGADRIAANGDTANKIGTYGIALLAKAHRIPFYVAAPSSTLDPAIPSGDKIPIEIRKSEEITESFGKRTAPAGVQAENPAFDLTPHELITAIVTEEGVIQPPYQRNLQRCEASLASSKN